MPNITYKNELIKRNFLSYLANRFSPVSIKCFEGAIYLWEDFTSNADFAGFNKTGAGEFKDWLKNKKKSRSQENVSLSYCYDNLRHLKTFFDWLSEQKGYKRITSTDIDYLNLSKKDARMAIQPKGQLSPTLDEVKTTIENIQDQTEIEMRDKALLSLIFLTGARISAVISLPMRSFDKDKLTVDQDPKLGVKTKFSKRILSVLFPLSYTEPVNYFLEWFNYLEKDKGFGPLDPIFPATKLESSEKDLGYFNAGKIEPIFWKSTGSARKVFENRFKQAGVRYYHPHTFRHLIVKLASKLALTEEEKKAISKNLGHEDVGTTFGSYGYGDISEERQVDIIRNIDFTGKRQEVKYLIGEDDIKRIVQHAQEIKTG